MPDSHCLSCMSLLLNEGKNHAFIKGELSVKKTTGIVVAAPKKK